MRTSILTAYLVAALTCPAAPPSSAAERDADEVLAIERTILDGWRVGNPDPAFAAADAGITYFHAVTEKRLDGLPALKALYESYRGIPLFDSFEIVDPKVQTAGADTAVLTYILLRRNGTVTSKWNATQVYRKKNREEGWRVVHSHFSMNKPPLR